MKTLLAIAFAAMATPTAATDRIPSQFVGQWCSAGDIEIYVDATHKQPIGTAYDRVKRGARKGCKIAEDEMIVQPTSLFIAGEVVCKLTKVTATTPKLYKLAFDCKHASDNGDNWTYVTHFTLTEGKGPRGLVAYEVKEEAQ
jgi:hypothetical protein